MTRISFYFLLIVLISLSSCKSNSKKKKVGKQEGWAPESYILLLDSSLIENSGIIYWDKLLWTFNDSGGKNELYALNAQTGEIEKTIRLSNADDIDWEDIAQNDEYIFVAETGNNAGTRTDLQILRFKKSLINKESFQEIDVEKIYFNFADQKDFNPFFRDNSYDCEALLEWDDSLYVFTKDWKNFITKVYVMPNIPGNYSLMPIDSFDVEGLVTGVDIDAKGKIAMVGYQDYKSFVWLFNKTETSLFSDPQFINLDMLQDAQTEGICFTPKGDLLISCEQTVDYKQQIWRIPKRDFR